MLSPRLYRAALVPAAIAVAIASFSLGGRATPLQASFTPDAFEGARALADTRALAAGFPDRRAGGAGDAELAEHIASMLEGLGGTAGGGFSVRELHTEGQTLDGERTLTTVLAQRPGSTSAPAVLIVAHRDAAARGSEAEMSGTAALLELARVFAARETKRTVILASTSGGSGGDAGAAALASQIHQPIDAAIVLGDLASARVRRPEVVPYSDALGSAPALLVRTVSDAVAHQTGSSAGAPSLAGQLAHLILPLAPGEQGVLDARGIPAVLVQASGERGPAPGAAISGERLEGLGRAVLNSVDALDSAPDISPAMPSSVVLARKTVPPWAIRLLVAALLLAPALVAVDGLARARRRKLAVGRWTLWTLSCALPFLSCTLFIYLLSALGVLGGMPGVPPPSGVLGFGGTAATVLVAALLTFALAWLLWAMLVGRLAFGTRPDTDVAGLSVVLVLLGVAAVVWVGNPYEALLLVPALHLWLLLASPELRLRRSVSLALVLVGLAPLAVIVAFFAHQLSLGVGTLPWSVALLIAGGHIGFGSALLWSVALGGLAAAGMVALAPPRPLPELRSGRRLEVTIRGPLTYAGPGSLGGTESALRR
ncbi:MAG TPA: M28 family peptidase [Solirubrobacteraceae bacterium]|nr:M28 family peptidase [Solirubrobacteraceae bacterium]